MMSLMIADIQDAFGQTFTYRIIIENPTVRQQSVILSEIVAGATTALSATPPAPWKYLKVIRSRGTRPPLFVIPSGPLYDRFVSSLEDDQPVFGFEPLYFDDVESAAGKYLEELLECCPEGPYYLVGYCLDGLVAYEMARMLLARGKTVALLVMIETFERRIVITKSSWQFYPRKGRRYLRDFFASPWTQRYALVSRTMKNISTTLQGNDFNRLKRQYVAGAYAGDVVLFQASVAELITRKAPYMGWSALVRGKIEHHVTDGTHLGVMYGEKSASMLTAKLKRYLQG